MKVELMSETSIIKLTFQHCRWDNFLCVSGYSFATAFDLSENNNHHLHIRDNNHNIHIRRDIAETIGIDLRKCTKKWKRRGKKSPSALFISAICHHIKKRQYVTTRCDVGIPIEFHHRGCKDLPQMSKSGLSNPNCEMTLKI